MSAYDFIFAIALRACTFKIAAVSVVLPWSMWPMVPTFTCGLVLTNFSFAMTISPGGVSGA